MKVYAPPIPVPEIDYKNYDMQRLEAQYAEHEQQLIKWLVDHGYTGQWTGCKCRFGVADGYAQYMLADGPTPFLIHLPYWDGYQYPDVRFLPKSEIIKRIEADRKLAEFFKKKESV